MKKLYFALIAFFLTCTISAGQGSSGQVSFGQMAGEHESIIPSDVNLFLKTKEIKKLTKTINYIVNNLMDEKQRREFLGQRDEFKNNTGIDCLDENSLRSAGIDTDRTVSLAIFDKDNMDEVNLLLIPVLNEQEAVVRFIEVSKRMNPQDNIKPVTAKYKNLTVYEIKKNIYVTSAHKFLIIGSTSDIVKRVIDCKESGSDTLILDENYKDYLSRMGAGYDLSLFITKRFMNDIGSRSPFKTAGNDPYSMKNFILTQASSKKKKSGGNSFVDSIDYIAAGIGLENNKLQMNGSIKLVKEHKITKQYLGFLKTGVHGSSIFLPMADSTIFLSLDYQYIDNFCKGEIEWCEQYNAVKEQMKSENGIDFDKDFLPYTTGGVNIISQDSGSAFGGGDVFVFLPMTNPAKIEEFWNKLKKFYQTKYSKSKKFGEEKIGSSKGFWFIDDSSMRFFVTFDKRGIYAGNSSVLMKSGLTANTVALTNSGRYKDFINDKTFFILNIKKNSFMDMFMQMRAQGNDDVAGLINRLGEIFLYCEKNDNFISVNLELEIKEVRGRK